MEFIEQILGRELNLPARFLIAFVLVLILIAISAWVVRRIADRRVGGGRPSRGRQQRLAVMDWAVVDARRRLVLIRRDHVEHLMMIGGPTDVVVESNIVRPGSAVAQGSSPTAAQSADVSTLDALVSPPTPAPDAEQPGAQAPAKAGSGLKLDDMAQRLETALQRPGSSTPRPPLPTSGRIPAGAARGSNEIGRLTPGTTTPRPGPASTSTERPSPRPARPVGQPAQAPSTASAQAGRMAQPPQRSGLVSQPPGSPAAAGASTSTRPTAPQQPPTPDNGQSVRTPVKGSDDPENGDTFIPELDFLGVAPDKPSEPPSGQAPDQPKPDPEDRSSIYRKLVRKDG